MIRELAGDRWRLQLDLASQILSLTVKDVPTGSVGTDTDEPWDEAAMMAALDSLGDRAPGTLAPAPPQKRFLSAARLVVHAKAFDDGLYAAVELAAQPRKARLIASLSACGAHLAAAARLSTGLTAVSDDVDILRAFLETAVLGKPLGFYTWTDELGTVFRQDRWLQGPLSAEEARGVRAALARSPADAQTYDWALGLTARLTNPSQDLDLRDPRGDRFFPPSRSHETDLVERLYPDGDIPETWSLMGALLARIKDGAIETRPTATSGWYDYQTWALAALARLEQEPEGARLQLESSYREHLDALFRGGLAATRETHVKGLRPMARLSPRVWIPKPEPVVIHPSLSVEPLPTFYERRARGYAFLRRVLDDAGLLHDMHRMTPEGHVTARLIDELEAITALFASAAAVAREDLGEQPASAEDRLRVSTFALSAQGLDDTRMMVPVFYDPQRGLTRVWALLGWHSRELRVSWQREPTVTVVRGWITVKTSDAVYTLATPVFAELSVPRVLNRDEFRALCDRHKTREAIVAALESGVGGRDEYLV